MSLNTLNITNEDRLQSLQDKMRELGIVKKEATGNAQDVIKNLAPADLATFIEHQFKTGEKWKSYNDIVADSTYNFAVQAALDSLGYDAMITEDGKYGVDGIYGKRTTAAVRKFQEDEKLSPIDGRVGKVTFEALVKELKDPKYISPNLTASPQNTTTSKNTSTASVDSSHEKTDVAEGKGKVEPHYDSKGKLLVDSHGNTLIYVDSYGKIPFAKLVTSGWGKNRYELGNFSVFPNGRVMNKITKDMFSWDLLQAKVAGQLKAESETKESTTLIPKIAYKQISKKIEDKIFYTTSENKQGYTFQSLHDMNPTVELKFYDPQLSTNFVLMFNLHNFVTDSGFDEVGCQKYIMNQLKIKRETLAAQTEKVAKMNKWVKSIQGKKYTFEELFPKQKKTLAYISFFDTFKKEGNEKEGKLEIDNNMTYITDLKPNEGILKLRFNQKGSDQDAVTDLHIPIDAIFDKKGNVLAEHFRKELAMIVKGIVEDKKNGFS